MVLIEKVKPFQHCPNQYLNIGNRLKLESIELKKPVSKVVIPNSHISKKVWQDFISAEVNQMKIDYIH